MEIPMKIGREFPCLLAFLFTMSCTAPLLAQEAAEPAAEPEKPKKKPWTDHLKVKGDLRYRVEMIKKDDGDLRYRHRVRARPAIVATVFDDLSATIGLGTGGTASSDDEGDAVSNNQTLGHGFSSKYIWLDLAYFDYHPSWFKGFQVLGGKMKNPLYRVGKSELLWDPDLTPEGLSIAYKRQFGVVEPFLTGVGYFLEERKADDDSWLLGVQGGAKLHLGPVYVMAGGRYMDYTEVKNRTPLFDEEDTYGNSYEATDSDGDGEDDTYTLANDFNIAGGFLEVGGKIGKYPWAVFGDVAVNTAVDNDRTAWLAGAVFGSTKEQYGFKVRYIYRRVQKDAVYGLFSDSDFYGGDTDGTGHEVNASFAPHKLVSFGGSYFFNQGLSDAAPVTKYHRVQIDLKMKF